MSRAHVTTGGEEYQVDYEVEQTLEEANCRKCGEETHCRNVTINEIKSGDGFEDIDPDEPENKGLEADLLKALAHGKPWCRCWQPEPEILPRTKRSTKKLTASRR